MPKKKKKEPAAMLSELPSYLNEALTFCADLLLEFKKLRRSVEALEEYVKAGAEIQIKAETAAPLIVAGAPSVMEGFRDFVKLHVKKQHGREVTSAELCSAYARVCSSKGWPVVTLRKAQKLLPYAMLEIHGVGRSNNISRHGTSQRGYANVMVINVKPKSA